jgi:alkylation response protein AidB-like acyl-CoA dehydrogenase
VTRQLLPSLDELAAVLPRPVWQRSAEPFRAALVDVVKAWGDDAGTRWEAERRLPASVFTSLGEAGFFRQRWAAGTRQGLAEAAVLAEILSLVSGGVALGVGLHCEVFTGLLHALSRSDHQREMLSRALDGEIIGCFASTEQYAGSDVAALRCTARREGDGWHLTGEKRFTSNLVTATHAVVLARVADGDTLGTPAAFVVPLDEPGARVVGVFATMGLRSCPTGQLDLDIDLPGDALLGRPVSSLLHVKQALQRERLGAAVQTVTAARLACRLTAAFARSRELGDAPLIRNASVRQRLAESATRLLAAEALLDSVMTDALAGRDVTRQTAALKLFAAAVANFVVDEAIQVLGGRGYLDHFPLERMLRDVRVARIGGGTDEVMRDIVAGRFDRPDRLFDDWIHRLEEGHWHQEPDEEDHHG